MTFNVKEIAKDFGTGAVIVSIITVAIVGYISLLNLINVSKETLEVLVFAPMFIYITYVMGGLRRLNRK